MKLFNWFKRKSHYTFDEEDGDKSKIKRLESAIRRQRIQFLREKLERLKGLQEEQLLEEQVADLEEDFFGSDDDAEPRDTTDASPDAMLANLFMQVLSKGKGSSTDVTQPKIKQNLNDDQLRTFRDSVPKSYLKQARKMSDEELLGFVRLHKPELLENYDDDTIQRAIRILKE